MAVELGECTYGGVDISVRWKVVKYLLLLPNFPYSENVGILPLRVTDRMKPNSCALLSRILLCNHLLKITK